MKYCSHSHKRLDYSEYVPIFVCVCVFTNESGLQIINAFTLKPETGSPIFNYPHLYSTFPFLLKKNPLIKSSSMKWKSLYNNKEVLFPLLHSC